MHPLVKEKRQAEALTSVPGHWGRTLNQATETQRTKKRIYLCISEVETDWQVAVRRSMIACLRLTADVGEERRPSPAERCFISLQQSVKQVERTRWPGKDLYNIGPCSRMIVLCVLCLSSRHTHSQTCLMSSEDKNLVHHNKCQFAFSVEIDSNRFCEHDKHTHTKTFSGLCFVWWLQN